MGSDSLALRGLTYFTEHVPRSPSALPTSQDFRTPGASAVSQDVHGPRVYQPTHWWIPVVCSLWLLGTVSLGAPAPPDPVFYSFGVVQKWGAFQRF